MGVVRSRNRGRLGGVVVGDQGWEGIRGMRGFDGMMIGKVVRWGEECKRDRGGEGDRVARGIEGYRGG